MNMEKIIKLIIRFAQKT